MGVAVVDTGVLIGMADVNDEHHAVAVDIVRGIDHGDLPTGRVTNYIILETLNWIHTRKRHEMAQETYSRLNESAGFEVLQATQTDFYRSVDLFGTFESLSFGDATIVAYMERVGIEYVYSFEDDFDVVEGISRLETPHNPFN